MRAAHAGRRLAAHNPKWARHHVPKHQSRSHLCVPVQDPGNAHPAARPAGALDRRPADRGPVAGFTRACDGRLGLAPGRLAGAPDGAGCTGHTAAARYPADPGWRRRWRRCRGRRPALSPRSLGLLALQPGARGLPQFRSVLARSHPRARHDGPPCRSGAIFCAAVARRHGARQLACDQPGGAARRGGVPGRPPGQGPAEPDRRCDRRAHRRRSGTAKAVQGGPGRGRHPGPGGVPQPPDRADPLRAADRQGPPGAGVHHPVVDHEVLHPRPLAPQLDGALSGRPGAHGVHAVVVQSGGLGP